MNVQHIVDAWNEAVTSEREFRGALHALRDEAPARYSENLRTWEEDAAKDTRPSVRVLLREWREARDTLAAMLETPVEYVADGSPRGRLGSAADQLLERAATRARTAYTLANKLALLCLRGRVSPEIHAAARELETLLSPVPVSHTEVRP